MNAKSLHLMMVESALPPAVVEPSIKVLLVLFWVAVLGCDLVGGWLIVNAVLLMMRRSPKTN